MSQEQKSDIPLHIPDVGIFTSTDVYDETGSTFPLSKLFEPRDSTLALVLIRHWGCTACQTYIRKLSQEASIEELERQKARIVIIGHGDPELISTYKEQTSCAFDLYSNPERTLYEKLGMGQMGSFWHEAHADAPSYHDHGLIGDVTGFIKQLPTWGSSVTRVGDKAQLGGEYVFHTDANGTTTCTYGRRMPNSRNHTMPAELLREIREAASR